MKALTIHPYYACAIASGTKSIEVRSWNTDYRGDLLICSSAKKFKGTVPGHALCVVTLKDVRPFKRSDLDAALMLPRDYQDGLFAWELTYNRLIKPIPVKGKLSLWNFDREDEIEFIPEAEWVVGPGEPDKLEWYNKYWKPIEV